MAACDLEKKTDKELKKITDEVVRRVLDQNDLTIDQIILYGSYARGDAGNGSDIDIMIICDDNEQDVREYERFLRREADHVGFDHDIFVQAKVEGKSFFDEWAEVLPFFKNVKKDGVVLYG